MLMYFAFKWKHRDGAMVEFEQDGWSSDDPAKTAWLKIESGFSNPWPIIPGAIRVWLQQECELIEFRGIVPECSGKDSGQVMRNAQPPSQSSWSCTTRFAKNEL
jgi:hypothetical protein